MARLEGGELRVTLKPCLPPGDESGGLALASEHAMQMSAADTEVLCGQG